MDFVFKHALRNRAVFILSVVVIVMMVALVTHAAAMDPSAAQIAPTQYCHGWCSEWGSCFWVCD